jgi:hypothetical protein
MPEVKIGILYFSSQPRTMSCSGFVAAHHERRTAFGMNQIDADLGQLGHFGVVSFQRAEIPLLRMFPDARVHWNTADPFRQKPNELDQRSRTVGRFHDTDRTAPRS